MRKIIFILVAIAACVGGHFSQGLLNREREALGLTRTAIISNAPPVLAFTTVALGSFRGLIANALWLRTTDLQEEGKYFEAVQLADWITKLQPHFTAVWVHQAWNMSYNISVKFPDPEDRWHWVLRGIQLLRDEGMKYNPHEVLMYRELGWHFQHKMGGYLDDAHITYKRHWAELMESVIPGGHPNYEEYLAPKTPETKARVERLVSEFKMVPAIMKQVDAEYGPLEWRLPEASAIYWGFRGMQETATNVDKTPLRREIFQPMLMAFQRGRLITNNFTGGIEFGPNLDIVPRVNKAYEDMIRDDPSNADHFRLAHRNFIKDAVYFLFASNREKDAKVWFEYMKNHFANDPGVPRDKSLEQYCIDRVSEDVNETNKDRVQAIVEGMLAGGYMKLAADDEDGGIASIRFAEKVYANFSVRIAGFKSTKERMALSPLADIKRDVLMSLCTPSERINPQFQAVLRTRLNLPSDFGIPKPGATNSVTGPEAKSR
ncbi:MAG TPA: hypothetical protein VMF06_02220 [Candidatus Limnocylindria bacterium]|jgi:hypothetical protein|nr:hypothetical protein [Candidatus Limnocylindria bacterium]